jgi:hypothetical protein
MTRVHYFIVDFAKGVKGFGDIKKLVDDVYGDMVLKKTQIYEILKRVKMGKNTDDRRGLTKQKNANLIALRRRRHRRRPPGEHSGPCQSPGDIIWHHQSHPAQPAWTEGGVVPPLGQAPVHTAMVILEFLAKKRIELLSHPPFSPDLTPANYFTLHQAKEGAGGQHHDPGGVQEGGGGGS